MFVIIKGNENDNYVKQTEDIRPKSVKFSEFAVFLRLLLCLFQSGSGQYKMYMVLPVLCECINNTVTWL